MRGPNWGVVAALGFGVYKATDIAKEVFDRATGLTPQPYLKSVVATGLAAAAAAAYADSPKERLLLTAAVAGTAALVHEVHAALSTTSDRNKVAVVQRGARAAMAGMMRSAPGRRVPAV